MNMYIIIKEREKKHFENDLQFWLTNVKKKTTRCYYSLIDAISLNVNNKKKEKQQKKKIS